MSEAAKAAPEAQPLTRGTSFEEGEGDSQRTEVYISPSEAAAAAQCNSDANDSVKTGKETEDEDMDSDEDEAVEERERLRLAVHHKSPLLAGKRPRAESPIPGAAAGGGYVRHSASVP
eukprot:3939775-Rhodomonas_salina.1